MGVAMIVRLGLALALAGTTARADEAQWSSSDYVDSYFRHYNGHVPLPHLRDPVQKALFNHLIDPANITRIETSSATFDEKLRQLRIILAVLGSYRAAYNVAVIVGEPLEQELTLVQAYSLAVAAAVATLVHARPAERDASSAWATVVKGVIQSVGDGARYSPEQRAIMADAVTLHYPAIATALGPDDRLHLQAQASKLDDAGSPALRRMKQALLAAP
jgi:alkylhydroperoxidase/carboxymuconolactone decarboxylase family protein YurZ